MKPHIIVSSQDLERLEALLDSLPASASESKAALLNELGRAEVVEPHEVPPSVVTMNSKVRFLIETSNEEFCLTLAYPKDVNEGSEKISVLSPVGSALLGLSIGSRIEWPRPDRAMLKVKILDVLYQPERSGDLHR
jgi:regulator of nucleoside diphosphate kinase